MEIKDGEKVPVDKLKKSLYIPTTEEWNNIGSESKSTLISKAFLQNYKNEAFYTMKNNKIKIVTYQDMKSGRRGN